VHREFGRWRSTPPPSVFITHLSCNMCGLSGDGMPASSKYICKCRCIYMHTYMCVCVYIRLMEASRFLNLFEGSNYREFSRVEWCQVRCDIDVWNGVKCDVILSLADLHVFARVSPSYAGRCSCSFASAQCVVSVCVGGEVRASAFAFVVLWLVAGGCNSGWRMVNGAAVASSSPSLPGTTCLLQFSIPTAGTRAM